MEETTTAEWMWADAGLIPAFKQLARANPLRWSLGMTFAGLAAELELHQDAHRGVVVCVRPLDAEHEFSNAAAAAIWARSRAASEGAQTQVPTPSAASAADAAPDADVTHAAEQALVAVDDSNSHGGTDKPQWIRTFLETGVRQHLETAHTALEQIAPRILEGLNVTVEGLTALMTSSQTELLLGKDGAGALEHIVGIYKEELKDTLSDVSRAQLLKGLVALGCLHHVMRVRYSALGALTAVSEGQSDCGDWWEGTEARCASTRVEQVVLLRRLARIAGMAYGRTHDQLLGSAKASASDLLDGNESALLRELDLGSADDILSTQWGSDGPHAPGFVLVADRKGPNVTFGNHTRKSTAGGGGGVGGGGGGRGSRPIFKKFHETYAPS